MNVLITGGTGVVGAGAIPAVLRAGHKVRLLTRHAEREVPAYPEGVVPIRADVADPTRLGPAVQGCECILHLAGIVEEDPPENTFERINVQGTQYLVDAAEANGQPFLILVSSLGAERGHSAYHHSKRRAEEIVSRYRGPWLGQCLWSRRRDAFDAAQNGPHLARGAKGSRR